MITTVTLQVKFSYAFTDENSVKHVWFFALSVFHTLLKLHF